ncbi:HEAT repeat domain-containing protein [Pseudomonas sp. A-B-19]|uniref:HEAT repeat domain-containing protein n=1 Tax=Pseudomonas sp. A-B-19 TaxID=2832405 RepID=UPI001CBAABFB|nr:HEAT repeat domain-containing protein [Pseudomonas sp. A-B-19]
MTSLFDVTDNDDILALQPRLTDDDPGVRRIALIELADLEEPDGLQWLINRLGEDPIAEVRAEAARLLEAWEDAPVVEALCQALTDPSPAVQAAAAQSLSLLKSEAAGQVILPWTGHADSGVRVAAFRALRELRCPDAAEAAARALIDESASVRREAVGVLGWLKQLDALPALARLASADPDTEVRRAATGALGLASDAQVLPALRQALRDAAWQVREEAATTLGKVGHPDAGPALIDALDDDYWQVRLRATRSLGRLRFAPALQALIDTLGHRISNLRKEAALALGELNDPGAIAALQAAQDDGDPEVRKAVRIALSQLQ